ncbi:PrsW family intramembrane metalloprotease [Mycetocola zhadangensis]|uniref:Protease PrsW n=1 Tax=Mycetocola zhadangensis TaxID=1164595 RepID=A0A3L7IW72_9MICO|nr:PrsW family intramembrane metalloprotease [Mycetocola zhadangensis]RLQ81342.1 protease PrsW [Mycetocola zhadangensis]GGF02574.1 protease PrsW [Mycetocola zhadangensis]
MANEFPGGYPSTPHNSASGGHGVHQPLQVYTGAAYSNPAGFGQPVYTQPVAPHAWVQPVWTQPVSRTPTGAILGIIGVALLSLVLLCVLGYFVLFLGPAATLVGFLIALLPLGVVLAAVRWIDRWEPEPRLALLFGFLWGAAASIAIALLVGLTIEIAAIATTGESTATFLQAALQAPIVEETAKGIGVLILFFATRKHFTGPVDGLVYAAIVAAGFAFTENIQYFAIALVEGGIGELSATFFMRAILAPFAHVTFTALIGLAIGVAALRNGRGLIGWFSLGLIGAILLHALWNGSLFFISSLESYALYYGLIQVPIFVALIVMTILVRRHEIRLTHARLSEYAAAGWFVPAEVQMLASWSGRRQAISWARTLPGNKAGVMKQFAQDATRLAFTRQRIITGRNDLVHRETEQELLAAVANDRQVLLGP